MRVLRRVLIKLFILALVIFIFGGGAAALQAYKQSTPEYAINHYLSLLIDNNSEKAYTLLDQSEDEVLSAEEYKKALEGKKYSLYSSFVTKSGETRHDEKGNEYIDYHAEFRNAADEVEFEDDFTVKKQAAAVLGIFDSWKIQSAHCMVRNFAITVPAAAEVYFDNVKAEASWITESDSTSTDTYVVPKMVPGKVGLTIRHGAFESVNTTIDVTEGPVDYSETAELKQSAMDECKEMGVRALKILFTSAAAGELQDEDGLLNNCKKAARTFVKDQSERFAGLEHSFKNVGISDFAPQFGAVEFTKDENGAIKTEMKFSFRYAVKEEAAEAEETEDTSAETITSAGDAAAIFDMAFYDGVWHVEAMELPVIPE